MAIFRNGHAVVRPWGMYPRSQPGDPLRPVIATWEIGLDAVLLTSETREVLCEVLECEHVVIDFSGAGGPQRRRCRQCGGGRVDKAAALAGDTAIVRGRKVTTQREIALRALEGTSARAMQRGYNDARRAAAGAAPARPPSLKAPFQYPDRDSAAERRHRELEATQYQACLVCGAAAGTACIESGRRHLGVVADEVHPGRQLLDPRKSLPRGGL